MRVAPFEPYHLDLLRAQGVQPAQAAVVSLVPSTYASLARPAGPALTAWRPDGRIVVCGGILTYSPRHGMLWGVLADDAGQHMLALHRMVRRFLGTVPQRRIEATVEEGFRPGCRWLELLGFDYEGLMRGFGDLGETHLRYALIRGD